MQKEIRDGLILRTLSEGHLSDRENLPQFYVEVFGEDGNEMSQELGPWTTDLMNGHPTVTLDDIWVIVDPAQDDRIVSAQLVIPQTWRYEDIPFKLGRVEIVATHTDYRRRGLIRELMTVTHQRCEDIGCLIQGITGIPHFYRQFGYAMAVELGGRCIVPFDAITALSDDEQAKFTLRPATVDDIPALIACDEAIARRSLLTTKRDEQLWRYALTGISEGAAMENDTHLIINEQGDAVGYLMLSVRRHSPTLFVWGYVVGKQSSYLATYADVIRGLKAYGDEKYPDDAPNKALFDSGVPAPFDTLVENTFGAVKRPYLYAWYMRVPDLARFMSHIAPVLERRLVGSGANRYTGELRFNFYDNTGLYIKFEDGQLKEAKNLSPFTESANAAFPWHYFLNLLFGHHSLEDLRVFFADVTVDREAAVVLNALFPKQRSWLLPVF